MNKILVFGIGYVGIANGLLLSKSNKVVFIDNDLEKIKKINTGSLPIEIKMPKKNFLKIKTI